MIAGDGVAHSEHSTAGTTVVHGALLWFALPDGAATGERRFEHAEPAVHVVGGAQVRVFVGEWSGAGGAPLAPTPLIGAEAVLPPGLVRRVPMDPAFETGVLVDRGEVQVEGVRAARSQLVATSAGRDELVVEAGPEGARVLVLAGESFESPVVWAHAGRYRRDAKRRDGRARWGGWNFVGRDHDDVVAARRRWQEQVEQHRATGGAVGRFGAFPDRWSEVLPAPELPTVRLRPRHRT